MITNSKAYFKYLTSLHASLFIFLLFVLLQMMNKPFCHSKNCMLQKRTFKNLQHYLRLLFSCALVCVCVCLFPKKNCKDKRLK